MRVAEPAAPLLADTDRSDRSWLSLGELVAGRYLVRRFLGLGGMGLVVEALDEVTKRVVALKFMRPSLCLSGDIQKRFLREMRILGRLSSEHALQVFESGHYRDVPFIVTEYLRGETVADRLDREGRLSVEQALSFALQACEALAEAHRLGIVHRDLKPENLFLQRLDDERELIKVLDFGISRTPTPRGASGELITQTKVVLGSPQYMSPEQVTSPRNVDARSDIWSLGVTLFELLSGVQPFRGADFGEIGAKIVGGRRPRLLELCPELPPTLAAAVERCLELDRICRPQSVAELGHDLLPFAPPDCALLQQRICDTLGLDVGSDGAPVSSGKPVPSDRLLKNERYRPLLKLGEGGSAKVTLAVTQGRFNKLVVLKSLLPSLAAETDFVRMFITEARLASRLNHPNVVQINDVFSDNGRPTLVMEYVEGQPLSAILRRAGAELPLELHVWILCEVLAGLQHAHEQQDYDGVALRLVHRDVSPQNVVVSYEGQVKVLDFGIAKASAFASHTQTGVVRGKVRYMAPEQIRGDAIDARVDIYSLGVMLWEALTGHGLWHGVAEPEVMRRTARGEIPAPSDVAPGCPPELERICLRALAPNANDRFASAAELRTALEDFLAARRVDMPEKRVGAFLKRYFGRDCERTRGRVQQLVSAMPEVVSMTPPRRAQLAARWHNEKRKAWRAFGRTPPLTALLWGAALGGVLTWAALCWG